MDQAEKGSLHGQTQSEVVEAKPEGPAAELSKAELNGAEADAEEINGGSETVKGRKREG